MRSRSTSLPTWVPFPAALYVTLIAPGTCSPLKAQICFLKKVNKFRPVTAHQLHGLFISSEFYLYVNFQMKQIGRLKQMSWINIPILCTWVERGNTDLDKTNRPLYVFVSLNLDLPGSGFRKAKSLPFTEITQTFLDKNPMAQLNTKGSNDGVLAFEVVFLAQPTFHTLEMFHKQRTAVPAFLDWPSDMWNSSSTVDSMEWCYMFSPASG